MRADPEELVRRRLVLRLEDEAARTHDAYTSPEIVSLTGRFVC